MFKRRVWPGVVSIELAGLEPATAWVRSQVLSIQGGSLWRLIQTLAADE